MIVPVVSLKLEINIRRGWHINLSFPAYSLKNGQISCLHAFLFLRNDAKLANFFSDVQELWYYNVRNQTKSLILSCPLTGLDARDVCIGRILWSVPLLKYQCCRDPTNHIYTFWQQCNLSPQYTVSAFHPFPSFLFYVEWLLQLEQVSFLDKDSNDRNNPLLQTLCCNVHRAHLHWNTQSFSEFLLCKSS